MKYFLSFIFLSFFLVFIFKANQIMLISPFYDFDEAHRAENAKRMGEYKSYLVPLTGSVFDREFFFRVPFREDQHLFLYYHLERPSFVYVLMILSNNLFKFVNSVEWPYRFPSFLMAVGSILCLGVFIKKISSKINFLAASISLLAILTSKDLWLSGMYAQLDTSLTLFLFMSLVFLILFVNFKKTFYIYASGVSFALSVLSKGQPAIIFFFPLVCLITIKKLNFHSLKRFLLAASFILVPWASALIAIHGLLNVVKIFTGFAVSSAIVEDLHHKAPIFWYARWWFDSFRPGFVIFVSLVVLDIFKKHLNITKKILLFFIIPSFVFYSINENKIWWYVLPLIPPICAYIYLSLRYYLERKELGLIQLALVILINSLPLFLESSNRQSVFYGISIIILTTFILRNKKILPLKNFHLLKQIIFPLSVVFGMVMFYLHFPTIKPYHNTTREVANFYKSLPGKKCLWFKDMPAEAILFYSEAGEVKLLTENVTLFGHCQNYLVTPDDITQDETEYLTSIGERRQLKKQTVIYQPKVLQLVRLD